MLGTLLVPVAAMSGEPGSGDASANPIAATPNIGQAVVAPLTAIDGDSDPATDELGTASLSRSMAPRLSSYGRVGGPFFGRPSGLDTFDVPERAPPTTALELSPSTSSAPSTYPGKTGLIAYTKLTPPCIGGQCAESIWVSALDGSAAKRLTPVSRKNQERRHPAWSPDGTKIAYVDNTGPGGTYEVWIVNANGGGRKKLATWKVFRYPNSYRVDWTSDGKSVVFLARGAAKVDPRTHRPLAPGPTSVLAIDLRTKKTRQLLQLPSSAQAMQLSPNGKLVAYSTFGNMNVLYVRPVRGGRVKRIEIEGADVGLSEGYWDWSPDSSKISSMILVSGTVAIVSASVGQVHKLSAGTDMVGRPIWSPDGKTILSQHQYVSVPDPERPGSEKLVSADRFTTIPVNGGEPTVVGPGTGSCRIQQEGDPDTGKRPPPAPCPVSDPSWQPRK